MNKTITAFFLPLLASLSLSSDPVFAASPPSLCINDSTGRIQVRDTCRRGSETLFRKSTYTSVDTALSSRLTTNANSNATNAANILSQTQSLTTHTNTYNSHTTSIANNASNYTTLNTAMSALPSTVNTQGLTLVSHTSALANLTPAMIFTVAPSGAQYTSIESAVSAASSAGVSASNPGIVVVGPGIYDLTATVTLPTGLTLQGSGIDRTIIRGPTTGTSISTANSTAIENLTLRRTTTSAQIVLSITSDTDVAVRNVKFDTTTTSFLYLIDISASSSVSLDTVEIVHSTTGPASSAGLITSRDSTVDARKLTVSITCADACKAILVGDTGTFSLSNSTVQVVESTERATVIQTNDSAALNITNSTLSGSSTGTYGGMVLDGSSSGATKILRSDLSCSGANTAHQCIANWASANTLIGNSRISVDPGLITVSAAGSGATVVTLSLLAGGSTSGAVTCAGVSDQSLNFYNSGCP